MLAATLLALVAAALHASWNLIIKTSDDRELAAWGQFAAGGLLFAPLLLIAGAPTAAAWPFLASSALIHVLYVAGLLGAYRHGDFSFAYPLSRGGGALIAALISALVLGDTLEPGAWAAIGVVAIGLASLVRPGTSAISVRWAGFTALIIGSYTVIDGSGARHNGGGPLRSFSYGVALTLCVALALSVVGIARGRGGDFVASVRGSWPQFALSGLCLTGAYSLVLVAIAIKGVPLGYPATLRESSVVLGAFAGWIFLHERLGRGRLISSLVVLAGMIALIVAQL